jgi:hypothetical protein
MMTLKGSVSYEHLAISSTENEGRYSFKSTPDPHMQKIAEGIRLTYNSAHDELTFSVYVFFDLYHCIYGDHL